MKDLWKYFDKITFTVLILISLMGIILIYSASFTSDRSLYIKQSIWLMISLIAFFLIFRIKTESLFRWRYTLFIALTAFLAILLIAGIVISGVRSWFRIGFISIQFSEFIKIPLALTLAKMLSKITVIHMKSFLMILSVIGIPFVLITLQPDLGTAFILSSLVLITFSLKKIKFLVILTVILMLAGGSYLAWNHTLKPYQKNRIITFFNPQKYSQSSGYQIIQSRIAVGSGGLAGKGYLKGSQSQYKFLPTRHNDFIIAVLGEEMGFMGISFLFVLFFILFYRQFIIRTETEEEFYFVYLFNGLIFFQFLINIMMSIGLLPVLGIPLPFVSYGGSSLLSFFIGEAIILKIKINPYINEF
jgi:rod shape determining protein RodA